MGFEKVHILGKIELDLEAEAAGSLRIESDIPGNAIASRGTIAIPAGTRRVVAKRLPYHFQGHLFRFTYTPGVRVWLFGGRVWARELPTGAWQWYRLPVVDTPDSWSTIKLEIPGTGEWTTVRLDLPAGAEAWSSAGITIPQTSDNWNSAEIEIPGTPAAWQEMKLPIKPTPPVPDWVSLEIDQ